MTSSLAAAHAAVYQALQAGDLPVISSLDRDVPRTGPCYVVGAPTATGQIVGGVCAAWDYEVLVTVYPGVDTFDQLVADVDTALGLLAAANIPATEAAPASRGWTQDQQISVYEITTTP